MCLFVSPIDRLLGLKPCSILALSCVFVAVTLSPLPAAEWTAGTGEFTEANNWDGGAPNAFEEAIIDNGGVAQLTTFTDVQNLRIGLEDGRGGRVEIGGGGELFAQGAFIGDNGLGTLEVNAGVMLIGNDSIHVGWRPFGEGEMSINHPDSIVVSGDDFQLGREGNGVLNFSAGRLQAGYTVIGKFGEGTWNQTGGLFAQAFGDVEIGDGGKDEDAGVAGPRRGHMNLNGGIMFVDGHFAIGNRRGGGDVSIRGGILSVTGSDSGNIYIGRGADSSPGVGQDVTLRVSGPDALIFANGSLLMNTEEVAESSTLVAQITGEEHSTIFLGGSADVSNGTLKIELGDYTPKVGDSWTLVQTGAELDGFTETVDNQVDALGYDPLTHNIPVEPGEVIGPFANIDVSDVTDYQWLVDYTDDSIVLSVTGVASILGDFNNNQMLDADDINLLTAQVAAASNDLTFDVNQDSALDLSDVDAWLNAKPTWVGDVNLDGEFNSSDLVDLFAAGKYESEDAAAWTEGDFNADGKFDSGDLISAFADGGYEQGPIAAAVPEATGLIWLALAVPVFRYRSAR